MHTMSDRQTDRQTDQQTDRQAVRKIDKHKYDSNRGIIGHT